MRHDPHDRTWQTAGHIATPRAIARLPETRLRTLTKDGRTAVAVERPHPRGVELLIRVEDRLVRTDAFTQARRSEMDQLVSDSRDAFIALGWTDAA